MNKSVFFFTALAAIVSGLAGFRFGEHKAHMPAMTEAPTAPADANGDGAAAKPARKIILYRNPMGLPDTSPKPKKDEMGMDYIPVYEGEDEGGESFKISLDKVQRAGVRSEEARMMSMSRPIRATGIAKPDERSMPKRHPSSSWGSSYRECMVQTRGIHIFSVNSTRSLRREIKSMSLKPISMPICLS